MKNSIPELSITLPLYNEEACARDIVTDLTKAFNENKLNYEIILVDNASTDNTPIIIERLAKELRNIKTVHLKKNIRFGGGVSAGLRNCRGSYLGFTASDGQVSAHDLLKIYNFLKSSRYDICKAKRIDREENFVRQILSGGYNFLIFLLFFKAIQDVNGYPVIMRRDAYEQLKLSSKNWMINIEILHKARKHKLKLTNVPVKYHKRKGGKSHVNSSTLLEFIIQLLSFRLSNLF